METNSEKDLVKNLVQLPLTNEVDELTIANTDNTLLNNLRQSWSTLLAAFIIAISLSVFSFQFPYSKQKANQNVIAIVPVNLVDSTNKVRAEQNLSTLNINEQLNLAAANKVKAIFSNQHFSHTGKDGEKFSSWIRQAGYNNYEIVGENLALGYVDQQSVIDAWIASPKHRDNIISPLFEEIGMAAATGNFQGKETTIIVQLFGKRNDSNQIINNNTLTANIIR